jgi:hypothetical protein
MLEESGTNHMKSDSAGRSQMDEQVVEFDIHGVLGIRLLNASSADIAAVVGQLGPLHKPLFRDPDITLRFVSRRSLHSLRDLRCKQKGVREEAFFVLDHRSMARVPFDQLGGPCEIICERGSGAVPLFMPILSLTALAKGLVAVHASAFIYRGKGIIMAGQAESGKTTSLLGFAFAGAEFVGEEWILLRADGLAMYGLPREIDLSPSHLETVPEVRQVIKRSMLFAYDSLQCLEKIQGVLDKVSSSFPAHALNRAITALQRRVLPKVRPGAIFGKRAAQLIARPEKVFLLISHGDRRVEVEPISAIEMAHQIVHLIQCEQARFMEHYLAFKSAFPEAKNCWVEESQDYQYALLSSALMAKETYTVRHPHPTKFSALYEALKPFCESPREVQIGAACAVS